MTFEPDYRMLEAVVRNQKPKRMPLYEHIISPAIMERILGTEFSHLQFGNETDLREFFRLYCAFFQKMTYDTVSFEVCVTEILPGHGAIMGGKPGPIQNRDDFERFPWRDIPDLFWRKAEPQFEMLIRNLPAGMKAVGGIGNGVFEISEDLVGYEYLSYMQIDDPPLFSDIYCRIGEVMFALWKRFLENYKDGFAVCRFGDDLGFKSGTLLAPRTIREFIIPQYKKIVDLIHVHGKPFLWHSCGKIFDVMDDAIQIGIDAKHSNEDVISPYEEWIKHYSEKIGLLGGIDVDILCQRAPEEVYHHVYENGKTFRNAANGYALGSGNSIPDYVPVDSYLSMIKAAQRIRSEELQHC